MLNMYSRAHIKMNNENVDPQTLLRTTGHTGDVEVNWGPRSSIRTDNPAPQDT